MLQMSLISTYSSLLRRQFSNMQASRQDKFGKTRLYTDVIKTSLVQIKDPKDFDASINYQQGKLVNPI